MLDPNPGKNLLDTQHRFKTTIALHLLTYTNKTSCHIWRNAKYVRQIALIIPRKFCQKRCRWIPHNSAEFSPI
jgi:hypothetical protein